MTNDTPTTNVSNAMLEHHYDGGLHCGDDCLLNRLLCEYIERYDPELSKDLTSAKSEEKTYYLLLKKLYAFAPTASNKKELEGHVDFCFDTPPEETL